MRIAFLLVVFFFIGCISKPKVPDGIIPQNEMRKIMWDLIRADAYVADFVMKDSTRDKKSESALLYEQIFSMHATNRAAFKKSLAFYEANPELLKPIADSLRADEKKAQEYQSITEKPATDSLIRKKIRFNKKPVKQ